METHGARARAVRDKHGLKKNSGSGILHEGRSVFGGTKPKIWRVRMIACTGVERTPKGPVKLPRPSYNCRSLRIRGDG